MLAALLLGGMALAACGQQPTGSATPGVVAGEGKPTGAGTPVSGASQAPETHANGHYESLLAADGTLYAGADNGSLYAFDLGSGQMRWRHDTGNPVSLDALGDGTLFAIGGAQGDMVYAVQAASGAALWQRQVGAGMDAGAGLMGLSFADHAVYVTVNGGANSLVVALDAGDGSPRWPYTTPGGFPRPVTIAGGIVYAPVAPNDPNTPWTLTLLSAGDGHTVGSVQLSTSYVSLAPAGVAQGVAYLVTDVGEVDAVEGATGRLLWRTPGPPDAASVTSPAAVVDGAVYVTGRAVVYALDARDGRLRWRTGAGQTVNAFPAPPVVGDGALYYGRDLGTVAALRLRDGAPLWQQHINNSALGLLEGDGRLEVATQLNAVYALDAHDGHLLWTQSSDTFATWDANSPPVVASGGALYVASEKGVVQALRTADGHLLWRQAIAPKAVPPPPVYWAVVQFNPSVSYVEALRAITDLGLTTAVSCTLPGMVWQPVSEKAFYPVLLVVATPAAPLGWMAPLAKIRGVQNVQPNPVYNCPLFDPTPTAANLPAYLPDSAPRTVARLTFAAGTSYDDALGAILNLGLRLADPCYERLPAGAPVAWHPMGQEAAFAQQHSLLVATTALSSTLWQQQARAAPGVTRAEIAPALNCP